MRVLVTGGAGFIGSTLCDALLRLGDSVTVLDNFDPYYDPAIKWRNLAAAENDKRFALVEGDVRDSGAVDNLFARGSFDAIVHLAALAGVRDSIAQPRLFDEVNVGGTLSLLEAARKHGRPRFILASTSSVYGLSESLPYREDDPLHSPVSIYGATKIACEKYASVYHHVHGLPLISLRFFTAYGPRQRPDMAIHRFASAILRDAPLSLYGDGSSRRDYTYIDDVVAGLLAALDSPLAFGVFNLGTTETIALLDLVRLLEEVLGRRARLEHLPAQPGDPPYTCADISAARQALGYEPRTSLADGLARFRDWLAQQPGA
ncbi:GDP-mannose 4,6-dehydratase [bacterium]|nr:GDP-mannose 4,6-dehydratase [bacterium]